MSRTTKFSWKCLKLKASKIFDNKLFWPFDGQYVQNLGTIFTVTCWFTITCDSYFMISSCRNQSDIDIFKDLLRLSIFASFCYIERITCVAQSIRVMRTWRNPHLPSIYHRQFQKFTCKTFDKGFARFRIESNVSRHELKTAMQRLYF